MVAFSSAPVYKPSLRPEHVRLLTASAIAPALLTPERYESVTSAARLRTLGFSQEQQNAVPGLIIHYHNAAGEASCQFRPDQPRKDRPKYETPPGRPGKYGLDIPDSIREAVLHSNEELWFTEGCKKADAAVSAGLCCVSLPGVWMFIKDKKPLPDFDIIPLQGRTVVIAYDSDIVTKENVHEASRRLAALLGKRGANVRFCYLPDDGESKVGLDDFLAAGHTALELRALTEDKLRPVATAPVTALIRTLNKNSQGAGTFFPKRLEIAANVNDTDLLSLLKTINNEKTEVEEEFKFWMGDVYNATKFEYGSKLEQLDATIGEGNRRQVLKWGVVCKAFSGDRNYFRYAAPWWFLEEIASMDEAGQDAILTRYVEANAAAAEASTREEAKAIRMNREKVREFKNSAADNLTFHKRTWRDLGKYYPEQVMNALLDAVESEGAAEMAQWLLNSLQKRKTEKATEEQAFAGRCEENHLFKEVPLISLPIDTKADNLEADTQETEESETPELQPLVWSFEAEAEEFADVPSHALLKESVNTLGDLCDEDENEIIMAADTFDACPLLPDLAVPVQYSPALLPFVPLLECSRTLNFPQGRFVLSVDPPEEVMHFANWVRACFNRYERACDTLDRAKALVDLRQANRAFIGWQAEQHKSIDAPRPAGFR